MVASAGIACPVAGATGTTVTTASFTPAVGSLLLAFACCRNVGNMPTISDSLGGTWAEVTPGVSMTAVKAKLWAHVVTEATARTVTAVSTAAAQIALGIVAVSGGNNTDFSNFVSNTNAAGDPTVTLAATAAGSVGLGFMTGNAGATGSTISAGYSEMYDALPATNLRMSLVKDEGSPGATLAWVSASTDSIGFGLEIKESGAAAPTGRMKVWTGSAWAQKPVKVWTGSAWVEKPVKAWNGSAWV